jgi:TolB protein
MEEGMLETSPREMAMNTAAAIGAFCLLAAAFVPVVAGDSSALARRSTTLIGFTRNEDRPQDDEVFSIYVMKPDGGGERLLARGSDYEWSPDGSKVSFTRDNELYVINRDGTGLRRVAVKHYPLRTNWSPDGRQIVYATYRGLMLTEIASGRVRQLTGSSHDDSPVWSPDGKRIAFEREDGGSSSASSIAIINADRTGLRKLTSDFEDSRAPMWSPNGRLIAYEGVVAGEWDILVMNADGSRVRNITNSASPAETNLEWSPTGKWIVFESRGPNGRADIHTIRVDGRRHRRLTHTPRFFEGEPSWNSSGTRIAFASDRDGNADIYAMSADGRDVTNLTNDAKRTFNADPAWSP